jgi:hypothetical protein
MGGPLFCSIAGAQIHRRLDERLDGLARDHLGRPAELLSGRRVLVVEHEMLVCMMIEDMLADHANP